MAALQAQPPNAFARALPPIYGSPEYLRCSEFALAHAPQGAEEMPAAGGEDRDSLLDEDVGSVYSEPAGTHGALPSIAPSMVSQVLAHWPPAALNMVYGLGFSARGWGLGFRVIQGVLRTAQRGPCLALKRSVRPPRALFAMSLDAKSAYIVQPGRSAQCADSCWLSAHSPRTAVALQET